MLKLPKAETFTAPHPPVSTGFEERRNPRVRYIGVIFLSWMDAHNKNYVMGKCLDISEGGLGIELARRIAVGTEVKVQAGWVKLDGMATVRHVTERGGVFQLGLQLQRPLRPEAVAELVATKTA